MRNLFYLLLLIPLVALAGGGDDITQSNDMNNQTTGDVNIAGDSSKAFGVGHALGDVDIAGCLGSEQWGTPIVSKQKLVLNWVCLAEFYLRSGQPELAAMALCNTEVLSEFPDETSCEKAHGFLTALPLAPPPQAEADDDDEELEEVYEQLAMLQSVVDAQQVELEQQKEAPPQVVERVIVRDDGAARRAKALAILDGEKE